MDGPSKDDRSSASSVRTKKSKNGPHDFDSDDSTYYSEYSLDSDMAIPGNTKFNHMQYAKKQQKAKAKAAEQRRKHK